jgi:hypothetical protein
VLTDDELRQLHEQIEELDSIDAVDGDLRADRKRMAGLGAQAAAKGASVRPRDRSYVRFTTQANYDSVYSSKFS